MAYFTSADRQRHRRIGIDFEQLCGRIALVASLVFIAALVVSL